MDAAAVLARLRAAATPATLAGMARFGIPSDRALGVTMRDMRAIAKGVGQDPALAQALWSTGVYEARTVAVFVADPARLERAQADAWAADFDNWAICDTAAFHLLDRTPYAWAAAPVWLADDREFVRRAGLATFWALARHDKAAPDDVFRDTLALIEAAAPDRRPLVRKAADMALRAIARRPGTREAARGAAARMASSADPHRAWIGRTALKGMKDA
jgi:3-methyladenine DNA glycosylase AlkD